MKSRNYSQKNRLGKFIVIEGIDGAGKSTAINEVITQIKDKNVQKIKGFSHSSNWDNLVHNHPNSSLYYIYFMLKTQFRIIPLLKNGISVIEDRYIQSIDSYLPDSERPTHRVFRYLLKPLFLTPVAYIYFKVTPEIAKKRLQKNSSADSYHKLLIQDFQKLTNREKEYDKIYKNTKSTKFIIDTSNKSVNETSQILKEIICKIISQ